MNRGLFRKEVLENSSSAIKGKVVINQPVKFKVYTLMALAFLVLGFAFIYFGEYTRKVHASGSIKPNKGLIEIRSSQKGVIEEVLVKEGQNVIKGQALVKLNNVKTVEYESNRLSARESIEKEMESIKKSKDLALDKEKSNSEMLEIQESSLNQIILGLNNELKIARSSVELAEKEEKKYLEFSKKRLIREAEYTAKKERLLQARLSLSRIEKEIISSNEQLSTTKKELSESPLKIKEIEASYEERLSRASQKMANETFNEKPVIKAPVSGRISLINVSSGESNDESVVIGAIIPENSVYFAEIMIPSKSIGFVEPGQKVKIGYEAFPYQRYGYKDGVIKAVSESMAVNQSGSYFYRADVELKEDHIMANGKKVGLQPGMIVKTEIIMDKQPLIQWLVDPFKKVIAK